MLVGYCDYDVTRAKESQYPIRTCVKFHPLEPRQSLQKRGQINVTTLCGVRSVGIFCEAVFKCSTGLIQQLLCSPIVNGNFREKT